jgi:hypothetical protein
MRGGIQYDSGIDLSGNADYIKTSSFRSDIGGLGELDTYWALTRHSALSIGLRFTGLVYQRPNYGGSVSANSLGLISAIHIVL